MAVNAVTIDQRIPLLRDDGRSDGRRNIRGYEKSVAASFCAADRSDGAGERATLSGSLCRRAASRLLRDEPNRIAWPLYSRIWPGGDRLPPRLSEIGRAPCREGVGQ